MGTFKELGVMSELTQALEQMDWTLPTEIQSEAIPLILDGGDILMATEIGSGKSGAFCIPIVQVVYEQFLSSSSRSDKIQCKPTKNDPTKTWILSPFDRTQDLVLSNNLLMARSKSDVWQGCRTNKGIKSTSQPDSSNRIYYEVHFDDQSSARVGWSSSNASHELGADQLGWGYDSMAKKSNSSQFSDYGQPFGEKFDIVGCILDLRTSEISFSKNGRNMGVAFKIQPQQLESNELYPTICVKNAGCQVRFGPGEERNDYKPNDCVWVSEIDERFIVTKENQPQDSESLSHGPVAVILEPNRELAKQTYDCILMLTKGLSINTVLLVDGEDVESTQQHGEMIHIVVCTPDEADGLLQQGFQNKIRNIYTQLPKMFRSGRRLQIICCSAKPHNLEVKKLAQQLMYFPILLVHDAKRLEQTLTHEGHVKQLKSLVNGLSDLESKAQSNYLSLYM